MSQHRPVYRLLLPVALFVVCVSWASIARADAQHDAFLAGYVQAVLEREFHVSTAEVNVADGVVSVKAPGLSDTQLIDMRRVLGAIKGVKDAQVTTQSAPRPLGDTGQTSPTPAATSTASGGGAASSAPSGGVPSGYSTQVSPTGEWFPKVKLFQPLVADPRWPHFGASLQHYEGESWENTAAVSFGESIPFYRRGMADGGAWEVGIQAALYAFFDLDAESGDLQDADYTVGGTLAYRKGDFSAMLRYFHQSTHIGDEFILANPGVTRINFSYEMIQLLLSEELTQWLRVYGGPGFLINIDPSGFDPFMLQYGVELRSPVTYLDGWVRPIAAVDVKNWSEYEWNIDVSARAGIELADPAKVAPSRVQLLFEYYNGRSPAGQFFVNDVRYWGLGMHFHY